jgi:WD40 repeat protein
MRTLPATLLLCTFLAIPALAQEKKKDEPLDPIKVLMLDRKDAVTWEKDIEPILADKCAYCHSGKIQEGKFDMGTYESLMKGGKRGAAIVPGKSGESLLIKLGGKTMNPVMPPKSEEPLKPEQLALLKIWIDQGAKGPVSAVVKKREVKMNRLPDSVTPVVALAVSPDKSTVAAGRGNQIHIYDAGGGNYVRTLVNPDIKDDKGAPLELAHMDIVQSLAFSADSRLLASGGFQEVILWDVQTGLPRQKLTGFADRVVALDFSRDGKLLATGGGAPTEDGEIKLFDVDTGKPVAEIKNGHSDTVFGVRFSFDGGRLATCAADKFVKTWDVPSGKFIKSFEGHTHHVLDVGWKSDGKTLASCGADENIKVWDFDKGEQVRTFKGHGKQVTRLMFIGSKPEVATVGGDGTLKFFNVDNGGNIRNFSGNNDYLYAVGVSPDGAIVAAGGQESVVRLYNGTNGQLLKTLTPPGVPAEPKK